MKRIKTSLHYLTFLTLTLILSLSFTTPLETQAQTTNNDITVCTVTPDRVDGQGFNVSSLGFNVSSLGFNVSSLGFNVSSLGFNVSSLGFNVSSLGFNVSSLEDILRQLLVEVTPAWIIDPIDTVISGDGYNSENVVILIVDDFTDANSHGAKVRRTFDILIDAITAQRGAPNFTIEEVNIATSAIDFDAQSVAGEIQRIVTGLISADPNVHVVVNMSFGLVPCDDPTDVTLTDGDDSFTVTADFSFDQYIENVEAEEQGTLVRPPQQKVSPVLECIYGDEGYFIEGYFGYFNPNPYTVEIPLGEANKISPDFLNEGIQPTVFAPGRHRYVFSLGTEGSGNIVWTLNGKTATAGFNGDYCDEVVPEPPSEVFPEGYGLSNYFTEVMGIPNQFVDEYFQYLFGAAVEDESDPFANLQLLMRYYQTMAYNQANDGNPDTNFALIPVASAGNFRHLFNTTDNPYAPVDALKPASYPEVIATSALVGNSGTIDSFWPFSHDGNIAAPGVSIYLQTIMEDGERVATELGAGTSYASPFVSVLSALWLTYPDACEFGANGTPPLAPSARDKADNAPFNSDENPLDCSIPVNNAPIFNVTDANKSLIVNEGTSAHVGSVTDPDTGDSVTLSVSPNSAGITVSAVAPDGTWSISVGDGLEQAQTTQVTVTATDSKGATDTVTLDVKILNIAPTATLNVDKTTVNVFETATLSLDGPIVEFSQADIDAGFIYEFDCIFDDGFPGDISGDNSFGCVYSEPGTYVALAKISDKDRGFTPYSVTITVESIDPVVCYASEVLYYQPGKRKGGNRDLPANRTNPENSLGAPQNDDTLNFVSLGFERKRLEVPPGTLILGFGNNVIFNNNGDAPDVRIWETSYRDSNRSWTRYPERARVYASMDDGVTWVEIGITSDKDQAYDLGDLSYATQIKLVDATKRRHFNRNADGFDVDAVEGFDCGLIPS